MYLILVSNSLYYRADTLQEVKDFIKVIQKDYYTAKILKCYEPKKWEEISLDKI